MMKVNLKRVLDSSLLQHAVLCLFDIEARKVASYSHIKGFYRKQES